MTRRDLKLIYRLLGDVKTVGNDASAWPYAALDGIRKLVNGAAACGAMVKMPSPDQPNQAFIELQYVTGLLSEEDHLRMHQMNLSGEMGASHYFSKALEHPARFFTVCRDDLIADEDWYGHPDTERYFHSFGVDHFIHSHFVALSIGKIVGILVFREVNAPRFNNRERNMLRLFHIEMARLFRDGLAVPDEHSVRSLSPRQKQVLWMLCGGDSEKQVAEKLSISPHTVHDYVKALHKHFDVTSRGQLIQKVLRSNSGATGSVAMPELGHYATLRNEPDESSPRTL